MNYELIVVIVNRGYSDLVMTSAREVGARGGTIISARGTGTAEVKKLLGITVSPSKELILILSEKTSRDEIMSAICKSAGLNTAGRGIVFSVPVDNVLGVTLGIPEQNKGANADSNLEKNEEITEKTDEIKPENKTNDEKDTSLKTDKKFDKQTSSGNGSDAAKEKG